jgi:hypothetical protein
MAYASLTTTLTGLNNELLFTAKAEGRAGNQISVEYVNPGAINKALEIDVDGKAIKVWLATNGAGVITTVADDISALVTTHPVASVLVTAADAALNNGSGLVIAMVPAYLTGGVDADATSAYATVTQLREYKPQIKTGATADALLATILDRATAIINGALGFSFAEYGVTATTKDVKSEGGQYLEVPAYKAASMTKIEAVSGKGASYESLVTVIDWQAEETCRPWNVYRDGEWRHGQWYRITAIWGYGPAPDEIVEVTLEVASNIWQGKDGNSFSSEIGVQGAGSVSFNRALTWAQRSVIDAVRTGYLGVVHA